MQCTIEFLFVVFWKFKSLFLLCIIILFAGNIPTTSAALDRDPFPDISFKTFSKTINELFSSNVSLATVLAVLFTLTNNTSLLNLHARQQNPQSKNERAQIITGWITALARALEEKLQHDIDSLFKANENKESLPHDKVTSTVGYKLDALSKCLNLYPYDSRKTFRRKLEPISETQIEPALVICPESIQCERTPDCFRALRQEKRDRDTPRVTVIIGAKMHEKVPVLVGKCPECQTTYYADHERTLLDKRTDTWNKTYLNSAKYIKIGQKTWADRVFSNAVLNGTYSFHASSSSFAEFWNNSFVATQETRALKVSRRQIWRAFVQESVRKIAKLSNHNLILYDALSIEDVTKEAFQILGENGRIKPADHHSCSECTHKYKATADVISRQDRRQDPAALLGVDENRVVPLLQGEDADLAAQDAAIARGTADEDEDIQMINSDESDHDWAPVKMAVLDGIVMGPTHCAFENCSADLANARRGVFCVEHEREQNQICRMKNCNNLKVDGIQTCEEHQQHWYAHVVRYEHQSLLGVCRLLRRSEEEQLDGLPNQQPSVQPYDEYA